MFRSALALLAMSCACAGDASMTPERFDAHLDALLCEQGVRCASPDDASDHGHTCHPAWRRTVFSGPPDPLVRFDHDQAIRCLDAVRSRASSCSEVLPEVCSRVWVGTQLDGDPCDRSHHCAPGLYCRGASFDRYCSGRCAAQRGEGEPCGDGIEACTAGLVCGTDTTCVPEREAGSECDEFGWCPWGLYCDRTRHECVPSDDAEGKGCDPEADVDRCPPPTDCNPVTGLCERHALHQLKGPGDPCEVGECISFHFCDDGTCAPLPVPGESCARSGWCFVGECVEGWCTLLENGQACPTGAFCESGRCSEERCAPRLGLGGACRYEDDCESGLFCDGERCSARICT
ncbi:MAG: hypothetical protein H6722_21570 [Sandaracinus sp.]|nr:hypothetical protein [Sandaracinus sp.]